MQIQQNNTQLQSSRREIGSHPKKGTKEVIEEKEKTIERDQEGVDLAVEAEEEEKMV